MSDSTTPSPLEDVLNDHILAQLESFRKQPSPNKVLFQKPDAGPSSIEMEPWQSLVVKFWCGIS